MRNRGSAVGLLLRSNTQDIFIFSRDFNFSTIPPCVPGRTKVDNVLLSSGYHNGILIDITEAMQQIHQGSNNYHQSYTKGKSDTLYNLKFLKHSVKLCNSQYQVYKNNTNYILKMRNSTG